MEREVFYYMRDEDNRPIVTVCLRTFGGWVVRGVAICSHLDNPFKNKGKAIAKGRAIKASISGNSEPILRDDALFMLDKIMPYDLFDYKSEFCPKLNSFEKKLLLKEKV